MSPEEASKLCPILRVDDIIGALWIPDDGVGDPYQICLTLIGEAVKKGIVIICLTYLLNLQKNQSISFQNDLYSIEFVVNQFLYNYFCSKKWRLLQNSTRLFSSLCVNDIAIFLGVRVFENCKVTKVVNVDGSVGAVETTRGTVKCKHFVNCTGFWARNVGKLSEPYVKVGTFFVSSSLN